MLRAIAWLACAPPAEEAGPSSPGWVRVPGGSFTMGRDGGPHREESPAHRVTVTGFEMQQTLVTVAAFRAWVDETGFRTSAERLGFAMVSHEGMDDWAWERVPGAQWRAPWGPDAPNPQGDDHPVVVVSWRDADAYCSAHGWRLPTEAEWEYAMRAGSDGTRYPWGDEPVVDGAYRLNFWQGRDHHRDDRADGWLYTSPVTAFPPNARGLYDPVGNTWQWTADWYAADTYEKDRDGVVDPTGPGDGWAKVARGGSWWCSPGACSAYGLWARGKSRPDAPYPNNGFRCVRPLS